MGVDQGTPPGVTGDYSTQINNDYIYPRTYIPPLLRSTPGVGSLFRGYLYPIDVDPNKMQRILTRNADAQTTALTEYVSAADRAHEEAAEIAMRARITREVGAQTGLQPSEAIAEIERRVAQENPTEEDHAGALRSPVGYETGPLAHTPVTNDKQAKTIRFAEGKQFQFNPAYIGIQFALTPTAPPESLQEGGTATTTLFTQASTSVELLFDRMIEVSAASSGVDHPIYGVTVDPDFAQIGVQKDIWDVFRICLGGEADYFEEVGKSLANIHQLPNTANLKLTRGSATDMMGRVFDLGMSSSQAWGRPVAVYYNANFMITGFVTGISVVYAEFNGNFVPTKAKMTIDLNVFSSSTESGGTALVNQAEDGDDDDADEGDETEGANDGTDEQDDGQ